MNRTPSCGPGCVGRVDPVGARRLSASDRSEAAWVVGSRVVRAIAPGGHSSGHPFYLLGVAPTLDERRRLLNLLRERRPGHVLPVSAVCSCSFESPFLVGRPLQDFGLGPSAGRLVHPKERRLKWPPGQLERLLSELAAGLENLHGLGIAHGDPALMNAMTDGGNEPKAVWIDLNSIRPATLAAVMLDLGAFQLTTVWPALLDAEHHSPALFKDLMHLSTSDDLDLSQLKHCLARDRNDHRDGGGRTTFVETLTATVAKAEKASLRSARLRLAECMAPLYFLDQTRSDQDVRFLMAVLAAERTRARVLEEERTRLHYHRFQAEIDRLRNRPPASAASPQPQESETSAAAERGALEAERLIALQIELEERNRRIETIYLSTSWRITAPLRNTGRLFRRGLVAFLPQPWSLAWRALRKLYRTLPLRGERKARFVGYLVDRGFLRPAPLPSPQPFPRTDVLRPQEIWPPDRPLISVVIPCFNYGGFVASAVQSILDQTFNDVEILIVDGGSTDGTSIEILSKATFPKTEIHLREGRHLVGDNRNFGIARARGKYICCLDADDRLRPTYFEKALFLLETQGYDVISTAIQAWGGRSEIYSLHRYPSLEDLERSNQIATCAIFRRELWERSGGYVDTGLGSDYIYEDWRLWVRFGALGARFANLVEEPLFLYRIHSESLSRQEEMLPLDRHREAILQGNRDLLTPEARASSEEGRTLRVHLDAPLLNLIPRVPHDDRRTVLLAVPFLIVGGAERLLSQIARALADRGFRLILISTVYVDASFGDCSDWFEPATAEIYHLPRFLEPELWESFVLTQIELKQVEILWIVGSAFFYDLLPTLKEKHPAVKVVDLLFNTVVHAKSNRKQQRHIDLTLVENQEVRDWLGTHGETNERMRLVESGVDLEVCRPRESKDAALLARLGLAPDTFIVGFSGRLSEEKSPETFLDLAVALRNEPGIAFLMTGAGPLVEDVRKRVRRAGMGKRLQFLGRVENVHEILGLYDTLVLPSRFDGRPVVVQESLAMGIPVVASLVGALPELVQEGVTGFLCKPGEVKEFAQRLRWLASHRAEHRRMRLAARAFAEEHFDARRMLDAYEVALRSLL